MTTFKFLRQIMCMENKDLEKPSLAIVIPRLMPHFLSQGQATEMDMKVF